MIALLVRPGSASAVPGSNDVTPGWLTSNGGASNGDASNGDANAAGANGGGGANPNGAGASPSGGGASPSGGHDASRDDARAPSALLRA